MSSYSQKLKHNYHELTGKQKLRYWIIDRFKLSKEDRFFFEGTRPLIGQMYIEDRKGLYNTILEKKPGHCFEVGTWTGGGSTFFLASAFEKIGNGKLVTMESDYRLYRSAKKYYQEQMPKLEPHVDFLHGSDFNLFLPFIEPENKVDCVFLDGSDNSEETVEQYNFFLQFMQTGSILMAHDWNTEKMRLLRGIIEKDTRWHRDMIINEPKSVGFVVYSFNSKDLS